VSVAALNDAGEVAGWSYVEPSGQHAFVTHGTKMIDLGTLGGFNSYANAINEHGQVVGDAFLPGDQIAHAFITRGKQMIDLGTLGGDTSVAFAINSRGQVTGYADTASDLPHAFLAEGGGMTDLGTLGGETSQGTAINAKGQVTGYAESWPMASITRRTASKCLFSAPCPRLLSNFSSRWCRQVGWLRDRSETAFSGAHANGHSASQERWSQHL
jgi:probable HAF family extracellular repeat protein